MDQVKFVQDSPYEADHANSNFVKAVFNEFYLIHSWILCPVSPSLFQINDQWNILEDAYPVFNDRSRCTGHEHAFSMISHGFVIIFRVLFERKTRIRIDEKMHEKMKKLKRLLVFLTLAQKIDSPMF